MYFALIRACASNKKANNIVWLVNLGEIAKAKGNSLWDKSYAGEVILTMRRHLRLSLAT